MTTRLSVRGKLDRPWGVPCTCGNRYAEHTDGEGCRVCACSRYRSIEAEATAAAEQRLRERIEALTGSTCAHLPGDRVTRAAVLGLLDTPSPASPRQGEPVDVERDRVRLTMIDGIGTELSREFTEGSPFEPFDRAYVVKTITRVLDAARDRTRKAAP